MSKIRLKEFERQLYESCLADQTTDSEKSKKFHCKHKTNKLFSYRSVELLASTVFQFNHIYNNW